jgi:hypothetical protein
VWIGSHQDLHLKITAPMHDSALGGGGGTQEPQWHIEDLSNILLGRE